MKYDSKIGKGYQRWTSGSYSPGQVEALSDFENSFILLSGAYRSGKTELGCRLCLRHATQFPGAKVGIFRQHLQSMKKSTLLTFLELVHPTWVASWSNTELVMELKNGSTVTFIGAENSDKIGSVELTFAFLDEAHEMSAESRGMIAGRLSGSLFLPHYMDDLPEDTQAYLSATVGIRQMFLACNPKSKSHSLYKDFIEKPKPNHIAYNSNSISNSNLPEIYLFNNLAAYVRDGETYPMEWIREQIRAVRAGEKPANGMFLKPALTPFGQRNLLGLWVNPEGVVYASWDEEKHVKDLPKTWEPKTEYFAGVDWGFQNSRIVVASAHGHDLDEKFYVEYYWKGSGESPSEMMQEMKRIQDVYDIGKWYLPPDRPDLVKAARKSLGASRVAKAKNSVLAGIDAVSRRLSRGTLYFSRGINDEAAELCFEELGGYEWKASKDGDLKDEVMKQNDHFPDALRYLVYSRDYRRDNSILSNPDAPKLTEAQRRAKEWAEQDDWSLV